MSSLGGSVRFGRSGLSGAGVSHGARVAHEGPQHDGGAVVRIGPRVRLAAGEGDGVPLLQQVHGLGGPQLEAAGDHVHRLHAAVHGVQLRLPAAARRDVSAQDLQVTTAARGDQALADALAAEVDRGGVGEAHDRHLGRVQDVARARAEHLAQGHERAHGRARQVPLEAGEEALADAGRLGQLGHGEPPRLAQRAQPASDQRLARRGLEREGLHRAPPDVGQATSPMSPWTTCCLISNMCLP